MNRLFVTVMTKSIDHTVNDGQILRFDGGQLSLHTASPQNIQWLRHCLIIRVVMKLMN